MQHAPKIRWKSTAALGYLVIIGAFGLGGGWAAVAEIDQAVVAPSFVSTETNRKTVGHYEGGIVKKIDAVEGVLVHEGDTLFEMETVQALANNAVLLHQLHSSLALEARLVAERDGLPEIKWPKELDLTDPAIANLIEDQVNQFNERRKSLGSQVAVLDSKRAQLETEVVGLEIERISTEKQRDYIDKELVSLHGLLQSQLVTASRVFSMERERTRLEGASGKLMSDGAKAKGAIAEVGVQIIQMQQKVREEVATSLLECRLRISEANEKLAVARDVLKREVVLAPKTGTVQNLKVFTNGQVVRPGEPLLDIVPQDEPLIVQAHFSPIDIDAVHSSQKAEVRFPSFHSRQLPVVTGVLRSLSQDRLVDDATKQQYYLGIIAINRAEVPEPFRSRLRPGMPAEVIVKAGERTVLQYLVSPLSSSLRKTFIEQ